MVNLRNNFWKPTRIRGNKNPPTTYTNHSGERLPLVPFKPSYINIKHFMEHRNLSLMFNENPWLINVKLYENPELHDMIKADFETLTIQLSKDFLGQAVVQQRDIFLRAIAEFIAREQLPTIDLDTAVVAIIKRYIIAKQQVKYNDLKHTTRN